MSRPKKAWPAPTPIPRTLGGGNGQTSKFKELGLQTNSKQKGELWQSPIVPSMESGGQC